MGGVRNFFNGRKLEHRHDGGIFMSNHSLYFSNSRTQSGPELVPPSGRRTQPRVRRSPIIVTGIGIGGILASCWSMACDDGTAGESESEAQSSATLDASGASSSETDPNDSTTGPGETGNADELTGTESADTDTELDESGSGTGECSSTPHEGDLTLRGDADLSEWSRLGTVEGNLTIELVENNDLSDLACLGIVRGNLHLTPAPGFVDVQTDLSGLANILAIGGDLSLRGVRSIDDLSFVPRLGGLEGALELHDTSLTSVTLPASLVAMGGNLVVTENSLLESLNTGGVEAFMTGGLLVQANPELLEIELGDELSVIPGAIELEDNGKLRELTGGAGLIQAGGFRLQRCPAFERASGLASTRMMGGDLEIRENAGLKGLGELAQINGILGSIDIVGNPALDQLWSPQFPQLLVSGDHITITGNTALDGCIAHGLAAMITDEAGDPFVGAVEISGNMGPDDPSCR